MAELFTEEDVRRYAEIAHAAVCPVPEDCAGSFDRPSARSARAILSALAEDGRLKRAGDAMYAKAYWEVQAVLDEALGANEGDGAGEGIAADVRLLAARYAELKARAESGGALPSDTPALADAYAAAAAALAGYATEPYGDLRLNAERASAKAVTAALSVLGLVSHSADPVSVLEEETRKP